MAEEACAPDPGGTFGGGFWPDDDAGGRLAGEGEIETGEPVPFRFFNDFDAGRFEGGGNFCRWGGSGGRERDED